jgi:hypothetical protein
MSSIVSIFDIVVKRLCTQSTSVALSDLASSEYEGVHTPPAILKQIERAIKLWNDSNYDEDLKYKIHDNVMDSLNQGLVLPIYHTLCHHPNECLHLPNAAALKEEAIQLSANPAQEGACKKGSTGELPMQLETPYL